MARSSYYCRKCEEGIDHEFRHGTSQGYNYHRCSCEECRRYNTATKLETLRRVKNKRMPRNTHGTVRGYAYYGCRKDCCRVPYTQYKRDLRNAKVTKA